MTKLQSTQSFRFYGFKQLSHQGCSFHDLTDLLIIHGAGVFVRRLLCDIERLGLSSLHRLKHYTDSFHYVTCKSRTATLGFAELTLTFTRFEWCIRCIGSVSFDDHLAKFSKDFDDIHLVR